MTDSRHFREAMAQFASGVTVVTTVRDGAPFGLTASSFASLSMDPPLVLVCVAKALSTHKIIEETGVFAVNILSAQQREIAMRFAGMRPEVRDRFAGVEWTKAITGSPVLSGCLAWADCRVWSVYDGGDHSIFVGTILDVRKSVDGGEPLLYHNRLWGRGLIRD